MHRRRHASGISPIQKRLEVPNEVGVDAGVEPDGLRLNIEKVNALPATPARAVPTAKRFRAVAAREHIPRVLQSHLEQLHEGCKMASELDQLQEGCVERGDHHAGREEKGQTGVTEGGEDN